MGSHNYSPRLGAFFPINWRKKQFTSEGNPVRGVVQAIQRISAGDKVGVQLIAVLCDPETDQRIRECSLGVLEPGETVELRFEMQPLALDLGRNQIDE